LGDQEVSIEYKEEVSAQVRFINAYTYSGTDGDKISLSIDGKKRLKDVAFSKISGYVNLLEGNHAFMFCPPNTTVEHNVDSGKRYSLICYIRDFVYHLEFLSHDDSNISSSDGNATLRLVHVAPGLDSIEVILKVGGIERKPSLKFCNETIEKDLPPKECTISVSGITETLQLQANTVYDCFIFSEYDATFKPKIVVSKEEPNPNKLHISTFKFSSLNPPGQAPRIFSLIWDESVLSVGMPNGLNFEHLTGPVDLEESVKGNLIKIKFVVDEFNIVIGEESFLPMPPDGAKRSMVLIDAPGSKIASGTWVVIDRPDETNMTKKKRIFAQVDVGDPITESKYGIQATVTPLTLKVPCYQQILNSNGTLDAGDGNKSVLKNPEWLSNEDTSLDVIRKTAVYAENSELTLAEKPIDNPLENDKPIELDGLYGSLEPGRLLIISGEREDLPAVRNSELAVLSGTFQGKHKYSDGKEIESDTLHTFLKLAGPLEHNYKRDTVTIFANVARATHGETREEILGSGDASKDFQEFYLRQSPLTYLAASTPAGAESTLNIRVNGVLWHEKESLLQERPRDHSYVTKTDNEDKTEAVFGDGVHAARLPSGVENVKAVYRTGIGKVGNVKANQITLLTSKPLGLKEVINPLPVTGGADRDTIDQARRNIPLTAMSLDHLVSVKDYEDFAKTFAAIGKASATHLSDGRRKLVHVTISGKGNAPIDKTSDLYLDLVQALFRFGDPNLHIQVDISEQRLLLMDAEISIKPDYLWSEVEPKIKAKLLERFGFERRELGQDVHLSEIISALEEVEGVAYVDVNIFDDIPGSILPETLEKLIDMILKPPSDGIFKPNQCVYASLARVEEKYEAEGWEDPQFIADRYEIKDDDELKKLKARMTLFSWDKIPGDDDGKLKAFLSQKFGVKISAIQKSKENVITATIATGSNTISLEIDRSKMEVMLKKEGVEADRLLARRENSEIIIYERFISVPRIIMLAQIAFFTPYVKEMLNLRPRVSRNE
jgi:hypothetical protein